MERLSPIGYGKNERTLDSMKIPVKIPMKFFTRLIYTVSNIYSLL